MLRKQSFLEDEVMFIATAITKKFLKEDNTGDLMALYYFYYYTAREEKTNQIKMPSIDARKILKWKKRQFQNAHNKLTEMRLIEKIKEVDKNNKIIGWYIKVNYIFSNEFIKNQCSKSQCPDTWDGGSKASVPTLGTVAQEKNQILGEDNTKKPVPHWCRSGSDKNASKKLFSSPPTCTSYASTLTPYDDDDNDAVVDGVVERRRNTGVLRRHSAVQNLVNYFFVLKKWDKLKKEDFKKQNIVYARFTRPAKQLLELCDQNLEEAKFCLDQVFKWADSRDLEWSIETVFKKWEDIDKLRAKEKTPFWQGQKLIQLAQRWYLLTPNGERKEFVGNWKEVSYA